MSDRDNLISTYLKNKKKNDDMQAKIKDQRIALAKKRTKV
jgi:hypothetical protein